MRTTVWGWLPYTLVLLKDIPSHLAHKVLMAVGLHSPTSVFFLFCLNVAAVCFWVWDWCFVFGFFLFCYFGFFVCVELSILIVTSFLSFPNWDWQALFKKTIQGHLSEAFLSPCPHTIFLKHVYAPLHTPYPFDLTSPVGLAPPGERVWRVHHAENLR